MAKIIEAANAMIANPLKITNVIINGDEVFFLYKNKYKWSLTETDQGEYMLFYYPGNQSIETLASMSEYQWDDSVPMIRYSSETIGTKEAMATFKDLYTLVKGKAFGIDEALDDIIGDLF